MPPFFFLTAPVWYAIVIARGHHPTTSFTTESTWEHARFILSLLVRAAKKKTATSKTPPTPRKTKFCGTEGATSVNIIGGHCRTLKQALTLIHIESCSQNLGPTTEIFTLNSSHAHHRNHPLPDHTARHPAALLHRFKTAARKTHESIRLHLPCHCSTSKHLTHYSTQLLPSLKRLTRET